MLTTRQMNANDIHTLHGEFTRIGWVKPAEAFARLYVRRGYLPDGQGAVRNWESIAEETVVALNDGVTLRMTKRVGATGVA